MGRHVWVGTSFNIDALLFEPVALLVSIMISSLSWREDLPIGLVAVLINVRSE